MNGFYKRLIAKVIQKKMFQKFYKRNRKWEFQEKVIFKYNVELLWIKKIGMITFFWLKWIIHGSPALSLFSDGIKIEKEVGKVLKCVRREV